MGIRRGEITTDIVKNGLVFNMDPANRASYVPNATTSFNTIDLSQSGTLENGVAFIQPPISSSCWDLDGTDDYIDCGTNSLILGNVDFTISSWLNTDSHSTYGLAFFVGDAGVRESTWVGYCANASGAGSSNSIGGGLYGVNMGSGINSGTGWHCVALTYDTTILRLYVDGVQTTTLSESSANIQNDKIRFGRTDSGTGYYYNGNIGPSQIYNRTLSAEEVLRNYNGLKGRFGL